MRNGSQAGFAYLLLLMGVAIIGLTSAAAVNLGARVARRDAEDQLLATGDEFRRALQSYGATGGGPKTLEELLKDPRFPGVRRHLRKIYVDPLTGQSEWGLERDPLGLIVGVYSLAKGTPIRRAGFTTENASFEGAETYREWVFGTQRPKTTDEKGDRIWRSSSGAPAPH